MNVPWFGLVSFTSTVSAQNLLTLLNALSDKPALSSNSTCQLLSIQMDVTMGGDKLFIGNANVTASYYGKQLFAGQVYSTGSMEANLVNVGGVWLFAPVITTPPMLVAVEVIVR